MHSADPIIYYYLLVTNRENKFLELSSKSYQKKFNFALYYDLMDSVKNNLYIYNNTFI
jgi:hypothetical protein